MRSAIAINVWACMELIRYPKIVVEEKYIIQFVLQTLFHIFLSIKNSPKAYLKSDEGVLIELLFKLLLKFPITFQFCCWKGRNTSMVA